MKKLISIMMSISLIFSLSSVAFADEGAEILNQAQDTKVYYTLPVDQEILIEHFASGYGIKEISRGVDIPTSEHDLSSGVYTGSFSGVMGGIYTNKYFTGRNTLKVMFENLTGSTSCTFYYMLYDITSGSYGSARSVSLSTSSTESYYTFTGLNSAHEYCVFMRTNYMGTASGDITVSSTY